MHQEPRPGDHEITGTTGSMACRSNHRQIRHESPNGWTGWRRGPFIIYSQRRGGDWVNHFTKDTSKLFHELAGDTLLNEHERSRVVEAVDVGGDEA